MIWVARAARTSSTRTTRTSICANSFPARSRPTAPCSRAPGAGARRAAVQGPARRGEPADRRASTRCQDALEAKGFYPAGGAEIAEAVQAAIDDQDAGPIAGADQQLGGVRRHQGVDHMAADRHDRDDDHRLVALRKQVIEDIYQIMGLSRHHARLDRPAGDAGRPAAEDRVRLGPHPRQAAGAGAAGARPGRDRAGDHHRKVRRRRP